jgi:L-alanine-DL-glutamate epimerase-like enolase superfamily enzyme
VQIRGGAALPVLEGPRPYVRVGIRDDRKILGVGEATPWPAESASSIAQMAAAIGNALPEIGRLDLEEFTPLAAVELALRPVETILAPWKTARFALETALLDVVGQRLGKPLAACLTDFSGHLSVPCNALLDTATDDLAANAADLAMQGRTAIKVKLRAHDAAGFAREVQALRLMRKVWPGELRLDPNGSWTPEEARNKLQILAEFAPRYVEQPVPADKLADLGPTACPWAADESLLIPGLPERLVSSGHCAAFVLKPALLGGFSRAIDLWKLAKSAGIPAITTHALDGPVGIVAAIEFATALPGHSEACGLDKHEGLSRYPKLDLSRKILAGSASGSSLPGLGFSEEDRQRWIATF